MVFETLSRRELQGLCKKNKIPANITNVAMIESLKALSFVEGLDELMQQSPGERAAAKQEPETAQQLTRTRRTTRKTIAKDAAEGTMETPAVVPTATRRARVTSVCRKMDAQLKECEEEDKNKGAEETPAPSGVPTRRRRGVKEESVVKREYSTRRSVRLAEKVVEEEVVDVVENEKSDSFKTELFAKDGENVNETVVEESLDTVEEASEVTGATVEENCEEVDESEVVSVQNNDEQAGEESNLAAIVENLEGKDESENNITVQEQHVQIVDETENATCFEQEIGQMSVVEDQKLDVVQPLESENTMDVVQVPLKAMDESENDSVKETCEDQDMAFDVNEEQVADQIYQVTDDSKINQSSEVSLMDEGEESAMPESFDSVLDFKPTCLTPFKEVYVRKATSTQNMTIITTDNKENTAKAKELNDLSVRQLTKMLKEKLEITSKKKVPQNKNVNEAHGRPALQVLPENVRN